MANAYQDALRQFATNSQRDQALGRPTQMSSTGLARANPPLPAAPVRPTPTPTPVPSQPPQNPYQVGWGSNAGQPRPGNTPYPQQPRQPAYDNTPLSGYDVGMGMPQGPRLARGGMQPPNMSSTGGNMGQQRGYSSYPPQIRPNQPQQQPFQFQQQGAYPWQSGNQQAPNVFGMPGWATQVQRPNYQQQFNPYSLPTQQMVRPMSPGQSYDSFMGAWQNPMAGMIAQQPNWRQSPAMPSIPQIPNMPQYQGPPNPWAQQQEWQRTQQPPGQGKPNPIQMNRPPLQYNPALVQPY